MARSLNGQETEAFFERLKQRFRLMAPAKVVGKGKFSDSDYIGYQEVNSYDEIVADQKSYFSAKEILFPIREVLFSFENGKVSVPEIDNREMLIFVRSCDIHAVDRLDRIFLENGPEKDFYYERRRKKIRFFLIECPKDGFKNCYCLSMGTNKTDDFSFAGSFAENQLTVTCKEHELSSSLEGLGKESNHQIGFTEANSIEVDIPPVESVSKEHFSDKMWNEYARRCIACGRCNTSCPTCSCFTMQDVKFGTGEAMGERRRRWAGCHVKGFTDMAGGHSFRSKNSSRMRFKTMHKINDYYKRFGVHMCVGCGRCDDVCPEYISFPRAINNLNKLVTKEEGE